MSFHIFINHIFIQAFIAFSVLLAVAFAAALPAPKQRASAKDPVYKYTPQVYVKKQGVYDNYFAGYGPIGAYRVLLPDGRTQIVTWKRR